jgi:hypothetical protein
MGGKTVDLHPRLANALVWACKQRGDWRGYASREARQRHEEDLEFSDQLTMAPVAIAKRLIALGLAEPANPYYSPNLTVAGLLFGRKNQRWITITPLGILMARKRFMLVMTTIKDYPGTKAPGFQGWKHGDGLGPDNDSKEAWVAWYTEARALHEDPNNTFFDFDYLACRYPRGRRYPLHKKVWEPERLAL